MRFNRRSEISAAYRALALPELLASDSLDLGVLEVAVESLDEKLRSVLVDRGVALNEFADLSDLERNL
jgi:hypothetical protein